MGTLDVSDIYCDDIYMIAYKYFTRPTGFWFDFVTSLPWSYNDLYVFQVRRSFSFQWYSQTISLFTSLTHTECIIADIGQSQDEVIFVFFCWALWHNQFCDISNS